MLSPFPLCIFMLGSIFGARPLLMLEEGDFDFYGFDISSGFEQAALIGLLAVLCLSFGYTLGRLRRPRGEEIGHPLRPTQKRLDPRDTRPEEALAFTSNAMKRAAVTSSGLLLLWFTLTVLIGGGLSFIPKLFAGRSAEVNAVSANVPVLVPAMPVASATLLAVTRIAIVRHRRLARTEEITYWVFSLLMIIPPSAVGTRRFLIPAMLATLIGASYSRWRDPVGLRISGLAAVGFLVLSIFPFVRSAGSRTGRTDLIGAMLDYFGDAGIGGTLNGFFLSYDTEMFNYVAFLAPRLGESIPFGLGRGTIGEALLAPIPSAVSPFETWSNSLLHIAFGTSCSEGVCPVPSLVGVLYYDLWFVGIIGGFLLVGFFISGFEDALFRVKDSKLVALVVFGSFAPIIVRGNSVSISWIALNVMILVVILYWALRRLPPPRLGPI